MTKEKELLTAETIKEIDHWVAKYPADQKQSAIIPALTIVQEKNGGSLTNELIERVADHLQMPHIAAYEVATFYVMFDMQPVGRHKINVCHNISCMLCGAHDILKYIEEKLAIKVGETTADGKFTLRHAECLAACTGAPMMELDKVYYENLTPQRIDEILDAVTD